MVQVIYGATHLIQKALNRLRYTAEYMLDRLKGFFGIYPVDHGLVYTEEENRLIAETSELIRTFFPKNPGLMLLEEDFESRCEAVEDLGEQLISLYGLEGTELIITDDSRIFPDDGKLCLGFALFHNPPIVYINANILRLDNALLLEHIISAMIHELRHVMQFHIITLKNMHGVPYERRSLWRNNMENYIDAAEDFEAYYLQPVEHDANNFTNRVWQKAYHKSID